MNIELLEPHIENIIDKRNLEWEIIFGRGNPVKNSYFNEIDTSLFQKIYDKLKKSKHIIEISDNEILDIGFKNDKGELSLGDFRVSFNNREDIVSFCKNQEIVLKNATVLYKKIEGLDSSILLSDLGLKSNQKIEIDIIPASKDNDVTDKLDFIRDSLGVNLEKLMSVDKKFRYKNRLSFKTDNGFRFDLTILKTPPNRGYFTSFRESNVLKGNISYELEMEYLGFTDGFMVEFEAKDIELESSTIDKIKNQLLQHNSITEGFTLTIKQVGKDLKLIYNFCFYDKTILDKISRDEFVDKLKNSISNKFFSFKHDKLELDDELSSKNEHDIITLNFNCSGKSTSQFPEFIQSHIKNIFVSKILENPDISSDEFGMEIRQENDDVKIVIKFKSTTEISEYLTIQFLDKFRELLSNDFISLTNINLVSVNNYTSTDKVNEIKKNLSNNLRYILSLQQNTPIHIPITPINLGNSILGKYMNLINKINGDKVSIYTNLLDSIYKSTGTLSDNLLYQYFDKLKQIFPENSEIKRSDNIPYLLFDNEAQHFWKIKSYLRGDKTKEQLFKDYLRPRSSYFMNPKPITLELDYLKDNMQPNILKNYTVTDKADGVSNLLYIDEIGHIYLIDPNLRVIDTGLECLEEKNSILNGELITNKFNGDNFEEETYEFYAFDIYVRNNVDTSYLIFCHKEITTFSLEKNQKEIDKLNKQKQKLQKEGVKDKITEIDEKITKLNLLFLENSIKTRLIEMEEVVNSIGKNWISCKKFYYNDNIFSLSKLCWDSRIKDVKDSIEGKNIYKYDGLIYTPQYLPIGYDYKNYFFNLFTSTTWKYNFKWKPEYENSIDFLIEIEKIGNGNDKISKKNTMSLSGNVNSASKYKTIKLYNGKPKSTKRENNCQKLYKNHYSKSITVYSKVLFNPPSPIINNIHLANIEIDYRKNMLTEKGEVIEDNTIVEFYYDRDEKDNNFGWKPLRVRNDKTIAYRKALSNKKTIYNQLLKLVKSPIRGVPNTDFVKSYPWNTLDNNVQRSEIVTQENEINLYNYLKLVDVYGKSSKKETKNRWLQIIKKTFHKTILDYSYIPIKIDFGNNFTTANNVWKTIFNPITEDMITTGENIDLAYEDSSNIYYNSNYNQNTRKHSLTIYLQKFHNFIKKNILLSFYGDNFKKSIQNMNLIDLACGKGGDLFKWKQLKYETVVGVDIVYDNIYNNDNGACARYKTLLQENGENPEKLLTKNFNSKKIPRVYFFTADSGMKIEEQILSSNNETEKHLYKQLWKNITTNHEDGYMPYFDLHKFNVVSLQFALHYFFENSQKLDNLIYNIDKNLSEDGIFIGTCYDGRNILTSLAGREFIEGFDQNQTLWKITKNYSDDYNQFTDTDLDFGKKISIFMHSINAEHSEFLVNFFLIKELLSKKNIIPLTLEEIKGTPLEGIYDLDLGVFKFSDIYNLDISKSYKSVNHSLLSYLDSIKSKMSKDEKKVSFLNVGFIYRKIAE